MWSFSVIDDIFLWTILRLNYKQTTIATVNIKTRHTTIRVTKKNIFCSFVSVVDDVVFHPIWLSSSRASVFIIQFRRLFWIFGVSKTTASKCRNIHILIYKRALNVSSRFIFFPSEFNNFIPKFVYKIIRKFPSHSGNFDFHCVILLKRPKNTCTQIVNVKC